MAVKDGSGTRLAAHSAKRCFLNCIQTSSKPDALTAFPLGSKDPVAGLKYIAVKDGSGPRLAAYIAKRAKRCFLNCLETSPKP